MKFSQEIADHICECLSTMPRGLAYIVKQGKEEFGDDKFPSVTTIFKWLDQVPEFAKLYARAREAQGQLLADETLDIADESKEDYIKRLGYKGDEATWEVNGEAIARSKLRIDTRKWHAAHLAPKKYGEQIQVDQTVNASDGLLELLNQVNGKTRSLGKPEGNGE
jgi:hypothetical protein